MSPMLPHDLNLQDAAKDAKRERMRLDDSGGKVHSVHMEHPPSMENLKVFNV